ncbi:MAG: cytochrome b/b6 domain-containing protein [Campylobacterota bacterium]|nr:cytochrome b/b6 domain-containing protein [Campylobacterota bacterium]
MSKKIQAYSSLEMAFHKHMIHFVVFLTISGLPILSDSFSFIAYGVGYPINWFSGDMQEETIIASGITFLRLVHWSSGFLLTLFAIPFTIAMLSKVKRLSIWPDYWGKEAVIDGMVQMKKNYIDLEHAKFGKMNIGQKASAWVMVLAMALLIISGYGLIFRDYISEDVAVLARSAHAISFIVLTCTLIFHIYFATHPANKEAYKAMFKTGEMDEEYVKSHHSIWYEKLMK